MERTNRAGLKIVAVAAGVAALAGCATPPPPPPPPPPPAPVAEIIPLRPIPPSGAAYIMPIPVRSYDGSRHTVNSGLSADERAWNFRAAWNVAALNCMDAGQEPILAGYSAMLKKHARTLSGINSRVDAAYRKNYSSAAQARSERDRKMTMVYNYFALPPARADFCNAAVAMSNAALANPDGDLLQFAATYFPMIEQPFETFFTAYEEYERTAAEWDNRYGALYGASQPGYVAVQQARAARQPAAGAINPVAATAAPIQGAGTTIDPVTGLAVPVVPVDQGQEATPVVQPVPGTTTPGS